MRQVDIQLFGALREAEPGAHMAFYTAAATIAELRVDLQSRAANWPQAARALLTRSAFASETSVLRDADALPVDGRLALLPPVSGG
jgi:molybdopterin synthase sulfur carrier subunit